MTPEPPSRPDSGRSGGRNPCFDHFLCLKPLLFQFCGPQRTTFPGIPGFWHSQDPSEDLPEPSRGLPRPSRPFAWISDKIPRSQILTQHFGTKDSWVVRTWDLQDLPDLPDPRSPRSRDSQIPRSPDPGIPSPRSPDPGLPLVTRPSRVPDSPLPEERTERFLGMWSPESC